MKALVSRLYARRHLGRSLAVTGLAILALDFAVSAATAEIAIGVYFALLSAVTFPFGALLLVSAIIVGTVNLWSRNRLQPSETTKSIDHNDMTRPADQTLRRAKRRWGGRIVAIVGLIIMVSPVIAAYTLPPAPGNEGGAGSMTYMWGLMLTIPIGTAFLTAAAIIGIFNMQRKSQ